MEEGVVITISKVAFRRRGGSRVILTGRPPVLAVAG